MDRISDERLAELVRWHEQEAPYGLLDEAWRDAGSAMRELTALRRPVEQSAEIEAIRAEWGDSFVMPEVGKLLSALDAAQRDLRKLGQANQNLSNRCATLGEEIGCAGITADKLQAEIARLSSPPPERKDIQQRQAIRKAWIDGKDGAILGVITIGSIVDDFDTLLQDLARARNSREVLKVERDAAREASAKLMSHNAEYCKRHLAQLQRIEPLETALKDLHEHYRKSMQTDLNLQSLCDRLNEVFITGDGQPDELDPLSQEAVEAIEQLWEIRDYSRQRIEHLQVALRATTKALSYTGLVLSLNDQALVDSALAASQHTAGSGSGDGVAGD